MQGRKQNFLVGYGAFSFPRVPTYYRKWRSNGKGGDALIIISVLGWGGVKSQRPTPVSLETCLLHLI